MSLRQYYSRVEMTGKDKSFSSIVARKCFIAQQFFNYIFLKFISRSLVTFIAKRAKFHKDFCSCNFWCCALRQLGTGKLQLSYIFSLGILKSSIDDVLWPSRRTRWTRRWPRPWGCCWTPGRSRTSWLFCHFVEWVCRSEDGVNNTGKHVLPSHNSLV